MNAAVNVAVNAEASLFNLPVGWLAAEADTHDHPTAGLEPRQTSPAQVFVAGVRLCDFLLLAVAGFLASLCCARAGVAPATAVRVMATASLAGMAAYLVTAQQLGAYDSVRMRSVRLRLQAILAGTAVGAGATCVLLSSVPVVVWLWPVSWAAATLLFSTLAAAVGARIASAPANAERLARRVAVVGINAYSHSFIARVTDTPNRGLAFVGLYDDRPPAPSDDVSVAGRAGINDLIRRSRRERIDAIVLALPPADLDRIICARAALRCVPADIYLASELIDLTCKAGCVDRLGDSAVIKIGSRPLNDWQVLQKSTLDFTVSVLLMLLLAPLFALIAIAIRIDSRGPVLFRQPRLGFNNNLFSVFKFRTMHDHAADLHADCQTTRGDKRITRIGRLLRRTSLDEVPQLLNVLRGEMSLVGPRPHALNTKAGNQLFQDAVADYALRHRVKPGITGWAQVNGWRGETRTFHEIEQRVAHDLHYIDNWSLRLDLRILLLTVLREFLTSKEAF